MKKWCRYVCWMEKNKTPLVGSTNTDCYSVRTVGSSPSTPSSYNNTKQLFTKEPLTMPVTGVPEEDADSDKKRKLSSEEGVYSGDAGEPVAEVGKSGAALQKKEEPTKPPMTPTATSTGAPDDDRGLSFEQIQKKYEGKIFNLILRMVDNYEDAQDLTVTTFINAYRNWGRFRGDSRVYTWLYQIAVNNCKNHFKLRDRRRDREPVSLDDAIETDSGELSREIADWNAAPEKMILDKEFSAQIRKAVSALKEEYRIVFLLVQIEGMSYEDTAKATDLSVPAVKTRLHRARNMIRQRLEPYYRGWSGRREV